MAAVVLVAAVIIVPRLPAVAGDRVIPRSFPVAAVDRLEELDPDARVLAEYHWGGYVIYRLFDSGGRVFVDGRNDMYDEQILEDYSSIRAAARRVEELLASYGADAILMPPGAAVVDAALDAGWCEEFRGRGWACCCSLGVRRRPRQGLRSRQQPDPLDQQVDHRLTAR